MSWNNVWPAWLLLERAHKENGCQFCSDNPESVEHCWGCKMFDWEELNRAIYYFQELCDERGIKVSTKEKYGTMRVSVYGDYETEELKEIWLRTAEKFPTVRAQILDEYDLYFKEWT